MEPTLIVSLVTAFGLGSVVTALLQSFLSNRDRLETRNFDERKSAYIGLLEAYHRAAIEGTDEAAKNFAFWQMRCELVASMQVREAIADIVDTNDDPARRVWAHENLKEALRNDLGISKNTQILRNGKGRD